MVARLKRFWVDRTKAVRSWQMYLQSAHHHQCQLRKWTPIHDKKMGKIQRMRIRDRETERRDRIHRSWLDAPGANLQSSFGFSLLEESTNFPFYLPTLPVYWLDSLLNASRFWQDGVKPKGQISTIWTSALKASFSTWYFYYLFNFPSPLPPSPVIPVLNTLT